MAKARKKSRASKQRFQPAKGLVSNGSNNSAAADLKIVNEKIKPVLDNLVSQDITEKSMALSTLNVLIEDPKMRFLLLKEKLVKIVLEKCFSDGEVQDEALIEGGDQFEGEVFGLLRNLCLEEGYDVCIFCWRQNILKYIRRALEKSQNAFEKGMKSNDLFEYVENVVGLISVLAGSCEEVFNELTKSLSPGFGAFLIGVLNVDNVSASLITAVCDAAYVLSEDNPVFIDSIKENYSVEKLLESESVPLAAKVYVNGYKLNTLDLQSADKDEVLITIQESILNIIQHIDISQALKNTEPLVNKEASMAEVNQHFQISIKARSQIEAVQVSIEIIAALSELITVDPSTYQSPELAEAEAEDDEMVDEDDDEELYIRKAIEEHPDQIDTSVLDTPEELTPVLITLLEKTLPALQHLITFSAFQSRALTALNNLSWTFQAHVAHNAQWQSAAESLWINLLSTLPKLSEIEIIVSCTGTLWALATTFDGRVPISSDEITAIIARVTAAPSHFPKDESVELMSKSVGLLAQIGKAGQATAQIADFFVSSLSSVVSGQSGATSAILTPVTTIDLLYAIFDLFSDRTFEYDEELYVKTGLNDKLKSMIQPLRKYFRKIDKVKEARLRERGDEAVVNLGRFIEYKRNERR